MNTIKQKQIDINLSKIINWPQPQSLQSKFELSFYTKSEGALIISKVVNGKYIKYEKTMLLNSILRISYTVTDQMVILRLSHRMGLGGSMVLGQFNISLMALSQKKQMKLCVDSSKRQYLIIEHNSNNLINNRKNKHINQQEILSELKKYEQSYGLQQRRSSKTKQFIKEREEFLQRFSNSSSRRSSNLSSRDKLIGLRRGSGNVDNKFNMKSKGKYDNDDEQGDNFIDNNFLSIQSSRQQHTMNQRNQQNLLSYHKNFTQRYSANCQSQQKMLIRNYNNLNRNNNTKRDNSFNNSEKTNSSSQRYLLLVNNLNIVPCDEYYETRVKNIVKQNNKRTSNVNQLQLNTNKKNYQNIYTQNYTPSNQQTLSRQKHQPDMVIKLKQQFKRHSQYY